jgi:hypothetical protein
MNAATNASERPMAIVGIRAGSWGNGVSG